MQVEVECEMKLMRTMCVFVLSIAEQLSSGATMADGDLIETWWYAVSALSFPTAPLLTATINARG